MKQKPFIKIKHLTIISALLFSFAATAKATNIDNTFAIEELRLKDNENVGMETIGQWAFYGSSVGGGVDKEHVTRIANLTEPTSYQICRDAPQASDISAPVFVYLDTKLIIPSAKAHSLDAGSCILVKAKTIDLLYKGFVKTSLMLRGFYYPLDSNSLRVIPYQKLNRWQNNWKPNITPANVRTPIVTNIPGIYRICLDQFETDTTRSREMLPNWIIEIDGKTMPKHSNGDLFRYQATSCLDTNASDLAIFPDSPPKGSLWYKAGGRLYKK